MLLVRISLRFGSLLNPIRGLELNICVSSSVFWIMFQFLCTREPICGFLGLYWVTITGASLAFFETVSSNSSCENLKKTY